MSQVAAPKGLALGRSAYSAALPLFSSDAPYELLFFRQPLNATTELLLTCDKKISNKQDNEIFKCYKSTSGINDPSYIRAESLDGI